MMTDSLSSLNNDNTVGTCVRRKAHTLRTVCYLITTCWTYLQQSVRRYLHHHGVFRNHAEAFLEQHGAHQVVDVVVGRAVQSQRRAPVRLRDAGAHQCCR